MYLNVTGTAQFRHSVTFPELSINITLQNSTVKSFIFVEDDVSIFYFYQRIFVSKVRVEIDAYLLFLYFTGCNIMIVSISGRKSGHTCTPITIVRSARVVFAITFLINDKSDNPAPVSLFFG